jgi:Protein of unknown function (DUF1997)
MEICFAASQSVDISVAKQPIPIHHYLRQPHRLVNALAASSQTEVLSADVFRLKMRPLSFMMLKLQPTVDLRVWAESDGTVQLRSLNCEVRGVEYINQRFSLSLVGKLQPCTINGMTHLQGKADLEVIVELPPVLLFTPKSILETTGNGLLKSVLLTVKQRLAYQLLADYQAWATQEQAEQLVQRSNVLPSTATPSA